MYLTVCCPLKRILATVILLVRIVLFVSIIGLIVLFANHVTTSKLRGFYKTITKYVYYFKSSEQDVLIVGINQNKSPIDSKAKYVFVVPRMSEESTCEEEITEVCHGVQEALQILDQYPYFHGATCSGLTNIMNLNVQKRIRECSFETRKWTMRITNHTSDFLLQSVNNASRTAISVCNIVEGPFVIRRSVFDGLGFRPSHGDATLLDFFLRSNGTLKIAASLNCSFLEHQLVTDRGAMANKEVYLDYGLLGYHHNILRIVREDTITWTQCTKNTFLCPEKPLQELGNPRDRELFPFCCSERLDKYLSDVILAMKEINMDYRLYGGTVLGAVRSKTIIPWTYDIDIAVRSNDYKNSKAFFQMEKLLNAKQYSSPLIFNLRRIMPMFPLTKKISSNSLNKHYIYDNKILDMMENVLPIEKPKWSSMGYVDIYPFDEMFNTQPSSIDINDHSYFTCGDPHSYLLEAFGESYHQVDYHRKSKDPKKLWVFWKWEASLTQEDTPTEMLSDHFVLFSIIIIGIMLWLSTFKFRMIGNQMNRRRLKYWIFTCERH